MSYFNGGVFAIEVYFWELQYDGWGFLENKVISLNPLCRIFNYICEQTCIHICKIKYTSIMGHINTILQNRHWLRTYENNDTKDFHSKECVTIIITISDKWLMFVAKYWPP